MLKLNIKQIRCFIFAGMFTYASEAEAEAFFFYIHFVFCSMIKMGKFSVQLTANSADSMQKTIYMYMASKLSLHQFIYKFSI